MLQNQSCYDADHPRYTDLIGDNRIVTPDYSTAIQSVTRQGSYSDMMNIYALSAVLQSPVRSYYPPVTVNEFLSEPFSRKVVGRGVKSSAVPCTTLMWSQLTVPRTAKDLQANHFAPMCRVNQLPCPSVIQIDDDDDCIPDVSHSSPVKARSPPPFRSPVSPIKMRSFVPEPIPEQCSPTNDFMQMSVNPDISSVKEDSETDDEPVCGTPLPGNKFLDLSQVLDKLVTEDVIEKIPQGRKDNVFFVLDNERNMEKRKKGQRSDYNDDCGVWKSSGSSPKTCYTVSDNGTLKKVFVKNDQYCLEQQINKKRVYVPLEPQPSPDRVLIIQRYYSSLKASLWLNTRAHSPDFNPTATPRQLLTTYAFRQRLWT